jgi:hypothetical protein
VYWSSPRTHQSAEISSLFVVLSSLFIVHRRTMNNEQRTKNSEREGLGVFSMKQGRRRYRFVDELFGRRTARLPVRELQALRFRRLGEIQRYA